MTGGAINVSGAMTTGLWTIANGSSTKGIVTLRNGANVKHAGVILGTGSAAAAAMYLSTGSKLTLTTADADSNFYLGTGSSTGYGYLGMTGGEIFTSRFYVGLVGTGVALISGGTVNVKDLFYVGRQNNGANSSLTVTGGKIDHNTPTVYSGGVYTTVQATAKFGIGGTSANNTNVVTVSNSGIIDNGNTANSGVNGQLIFNSSGLDGQLDMFNLNTGGTLITVSVAKGVAGASSAVFNFNGGTLRAAATDTASSTKWFDFSRNAGTTVVMPGKTYVYSGGALLDTQAFNVTVASPLVAPIGSGITAIMPNSNVGAGFIGAPAIAISGGATLANAVSQANSNLINVSDTSSLIVGQTVTIAGSGIPLNTVITSIESGTTFRISQNATTGTTATLTYGGTGASAIANMVDDGTGNGTYKIGSITITNPGIGYVGTPTVTLNYGGATTAAVTTGWTFLLATNTSGGLAKSGSGTLTLSAANTYTGTTAINEGTLALTQTGSINNSARIAVATGATFDVQAITGYTLGTAQTLSGTGTVSGFSLINGTVEPGIGSAIGSLQRLTLGRVSFTPGSRLSLAIGAGANNNAQLYGTDNIVLDGVLLSFNVGSVLDQMQYVLIDDHLGTLSGSFAGIIGLPSGYHLTMLTNMLTLDRDASQATSGVWNVNGGGSWNIAANWTASGVPGLDPALMQSDTALFGSVLTGGTATVALNGVSPSLASVTFNNAAGSYTIAMGSGGSLHFNSTTTATVANGSGYHTISAPIVLDADTTFSVTNMADILTISGAVSGAKSVTKTNAGTLVLGGNNTYTGPTTVSGGTLVAGSVGAPQTLYQSSTVSVSTGATLIATGTTLGSLAIGSQAVISPGSNDAAPPAVHDPAYSYAGVGEFAAAGGITFAAGSTLNFEFLGGLHVADESSQVAQAGTSWDLLQTSGGTIDLGSGVIQLNVFAMATDSMKGTNPADSASLYAFDPAGSGSNSYHWLFAYAGPGTGKILFSGDSDINHHFTIDASQVYSTYGASLLAGSFFITQVDNGLYLNYSAVPEPGSLLLPGHPALACAWRRPNRRSPPPLHDSAAQLSIVH